MEAQEEFMVSNDLTQIVKGKRTRRQRSSSPCKAATMTSSSSSDCVGDGDGEPGLVVDELRSISSLTTCSEVYESTEEEEDMANCLILLAQGDRPRQTEKFSDIATITTTNKAGFYVYECKTCNRSFPSFQALGGHRASHKRPKATIEEKKPAPVAASTIDDVAACQFNKSSPEPPLSLQVPIVNNNNINKGFVGNNKAKIHECQICGSEFTSGQALGGHMRRHRANTSSQVAITSTDTTTAGMIKPGTNVFPLDLNLPAPEDDHHESKFHQFSSTTTQQALVFSAPALVGCHY